MDKNIMKPFGEVFRLHGEKSLEVFEKATFVVALTADKTENKITAKLYSERILESSEISAAEETIARKFRLNKAKLLPTYPRNLLTDEYFISLDKRLRAEFPAATGHLCGKQHSDIETP